MKRFDMKMFCGFEFVMKMRQRSRHFKAIPSLCNESMNFLTNIYNGILNMFMSIEFVAVSMQQKGEFLSFLQTFLSSDIIAVALAFHTNIIGNISM